MLPQVQERSQQNQKKGTYLIQLNRRRQVADLRDQDVFNRDLKQLKYRFQYCKNPKLYAK